MTNPDDEPAKLVANLEIQVGISYQFSVKFLSKQAEKHPTTECKLWEPNFKFATCARFY